MFWFITHSKSMSLSSASVWPPSWWRHNKNATSLPTSKKEATPDQALLHPACTCRVCCLFRVLNLKLISWCWQFVGTWAIYCRLNATMILLARQVPRLLIIGRAGWNVDLPLAHLAVITCYDGSLVDICYAPAIPLNSSFKPVHVASPNLSSYALSSHHVSGSWEVKERWALWSKSWHKLWRERALCQHSHLSP